MPYICYDIKGIQRFIFSVPLLKCIVGGSSLIDRFDNGSAELVNRIQSCDWIYAGGGKGAFHCETVEDAAQLKTELRDEAHRVGLDIQFGSDDDLKIAASNAEEFFPYCPDDLSGEPCAISGLLPAQPGKVNGMIRLRINEGRKDTFGDRILEQLIPHLSEELQRNRVVFFRNVSPKIGNLDEPERDVLLEEQRHALRAQYAMGNRNRWAVIAMDGNDIGTQFSAFQQQTPVPTPPEYRTWLKYMSEKMKSCTLNAVVAGLAAVLNAWAEDIDLDECSFEDRSGQPVTVLPVRPLILGGDDVVLLCHSSYAFKFAQTVAAKFAAESKLAASEYKLGKLWPGTGGELSISAGVLFCNLHLPLHSAIPYAEDLLKNAKSVYRQHQLSTDLDARTPTPAAIDFEVVTDSLLDSPTERRRRDLIFVDPELNDAQRSLTRRPYRLGDESDSGTSNPQRPQDTLTALSEVAEKLAQIPASVRSQFLPNFKRPWSERTEFLSSLSKRYPKFVEDFWEESFAEDHVQTGKGWISNASDAANENDRECGLADALILLEERRRREQTTV